MMKPGRKIFAVLILALAAAPLCRADGTARIDTVRLTPGKHVRHGDALMYCFVPRDPCGAAAVICPGGSYCWLDMENEGALVARWLNSQGITAFLLHYRTIGFGAFFWHSRLVSRGNRHPDMLEDIQTALQRADSLASDYRFDRGRLGVIGFSAGGHLAMSSACFSGPVRPAFVAPIYPVVTMRSPYVHKRSRRALLGDDFQRNKVLIDSLSLEFHIPAGCPPVFLVNCRDDRVVDYHNSVLLDSALTAEGIRHNYRQYETGGHGFGVSEDLGSEESRRWKQEFLEWLKDIDILE